ncbi:hypothetical protein SALBM311S_05568 [Streptomyces alboniger]
MSDLESLPDPSASRAVLIGASTFTDEELNDLPAVREGVSTLYELLTGPMWHLPERHCTKVLDPETPTAVGDAIEDAADAATDTLFVYYSGHGILDSKGRLYLAVPGSRQDGNRSHLNAVPYHEWVRGPLEKCSARRRIVILDCCYSARAMDDAQGTDLAGLAEIDGTFILTAAGRTEYALSPPGEEYTAFTGALVRLLREGEESAPELLDLSTTAFHIRRRLQADNRPAAHCFEEDFVGRLPFARNAAYEPYPDALVDDLVEALHKAAQDERDLSQTCRTVAEAIVTGLGYAYAQVRLVEQNGRLMSRAALGDPVPGTSTSPDTASPDAWDMLLAEGKEEGRLRLLDRRLRAPLYLPGGAPLGIVEVHVPPQRAMPGARRLKNLETYAYHASVALTYVRVLADAREALDGSHAEVAALTTQSQATQKLQEEIAQQLQAMREQNSRLRSRVRQTERFYSERESTFVQRLMATRHELAERDRELSRLLEEFSAADGVPEEWVVPAQVGETQPAAQEQLQKKSSYNSLTDHRVGPEEQATAESRKAVPTTRTAPSPVRRSPVVPTAVTDPDPGGTGWGRGKKVLLGTAIAAFVAFLIVMVALDVPLTLQYKSGDKPRETIDCATATQEPICQSSAQNWRVPRNGTVRTVFDPSAGKYEWQLRGTLYLHSKCAASVRWSVTAGTTMVAEGTLSASHQDRVLTEDLPPHTPALIVTAKRTDSSTCTADFIWAGVFQPA